MGSCINGPKSAWTLKQSTSASARATLKSVLVREGAQWANGRSSPEYPIFMGRVGPPVSLQLDETGRGWAVLPRRQGDMLHWP